MTYLPGAKSDIAPWESMFRRDSALLLSSISFVPPLFLFLLPRMSDDQQVEAVEEQQYASFAIVSLGSSVSIAIDFGFTFSPPLRFAIVLFFSVDFRLHFFIGS
jgi:hypothetical protein